jgi:hypothetical protein
MPDNQRQDRTLSPTMEELDRVTGISDLTYAITRFIDPTRSHNGPKNVAYVYLAFCQTLQAQNLASIDSMPSFDISYRGLQHTVSALQNLPLTFS